MRRTPQHTNLGRGGKARATVETRDVYDWQALDRISAQRQIERMVARVNSGDVEVWR